MSKRNPEAVWMYLDCRKDDEPYKAPALRISEHIAVNQEFDWPGMYVVAHIPTGVAIAWRIRGLQAAISVANRIAELPLWGKQLADRGMPTDALIAGWPEACSLINAAIGEADLTCIVSDKGAYRVLPLEYKEIPHE